MQTHPDILDEQDRLGKPFVTSIVVHGALFGIFAGYTLFGWGKTEQWGKPDSLGGGAVGIQAVHTIAMPQQVAPRNLVANDTNSLIPEAPKPKIQPRTEPKPDPNAVKLKSKAELKKLADKFEQQHKYNPRDYQKNQVFTKQGQALSSPLFSAKPGGGGVGSGDTSPFGTRLGWYEQILRDRVAGNWHSELLDARLGQHPAVVGFVLMRDGSIRNLRIVQTSGNFALDQSALRAITTSTPFPPLPREFERDSANLEFNFFLQK